MYAEEVVPYFHGSQTFQILQKRVDSLDNISAINWTIFLFLAY